MKIALGNRSVKILVASEPEVKSVAALFPNWIINKVGLGIPDGIAYGKNNLTNNHQPLRLLCFSRIAEKKRIDMCLQALAELNKRDQKYTLTIVGTGNPELIEELQLLCKKLDLVSNVIFRGHISDEIEIRSLFEESDIFLLPSENENFAIAVSESIGFSVPVIVSKFVAMHDFVDEYSTGLTLVELSIPAIVEAILRIEQNYSHFRDNCENSRGLLSWTNVSRNWINALMDSEFSSDGK
jgi:glycosyltransferase involved in cell wall biosynthesis